MERNSDGLSKQADMRMPKWARAQHALSQPTLQWLRLGNPSSPRRAPKPASI